jgi:hypothetical protein
MEAEHSCTIEVPARHAPVIGEAAHSKITPVPVNAGVENSGHAPHRAKRMKIPERISNSL